MKVLECIPGNPLAIAYRWIDQSAVALMARLPAFCRVVGLQAGHEGHLQALVRWYREHDSKPTFEMLPGLYDAALGRELTRLGFYQSGFHACLIGNAAVVRTNAAAEIELVRSSAGMEDYL